MRPAHKVPGVGELREITMWKAIVFGILTLGIYFLVLVYQNTKDIQEARQKPFAAWQAIFWIAIIVWPLHLVNYVMNGLGLSELRKTTRQADSSLWIVSLVLILVSPVGQIMWTIHYNDTVRTAARAHSARPIQQAMTAPA